MKGRTLRVYLPIAMGFALVANALAGPDNKGAVGGIPTFEELLRQNLSLGQALNIASEQNALIRAARSDVEARYGIAVQVRAIVLPKALSEVGYQVAQDSLIETNEESIVGPLINNQ